jgi:S-formylglutathione hydrolase FrmB
LVANDLVKLVDITSDTLSKWWKKPVHVKASVLLPAKYKPGSAYPIRYNVAGYGGRYDRINYIVQNKTFMDWWQSDEAPQVINVFLDGEGPFGDSYQMDSDNSGPYGYSLIHEVIPFIEKTYRGTSSAETRFVDGCSTGGWVSLGLQLYYPDVFNGVFSYSPDAIEFEDYQLINIYKDENAFVNEYGYLRPVMREVTGEPMLSLKDFIQYENVLGSSNTYLNSGGQFSAHAALYSPKGKGGLPKPLFDPTTGAIDHSVAEYWKKYDFKLFAEKNWPTLGPKLQGKIYIWMGDMDNFYLNVGTRGFDKFIKATTNPTSDAEIVFTPMKGHCENYSNKTVLLQVADRLKKINDKKAK